VISALQICPSDPRRIIVTSKDSKIRVADGDGIQKFNGMPALRVIILQSCYTW
jgi:hypothetical protein